MFVGCVMCVSGWWRPTRRQLRWWHPNRSASAAVICLMVTLKPCKINISCLHFPRLAKRKFTKDCYGNDRGKYTNDITIRKKKEAPTAKRIVDHAVVLYSYIVHFIHIHYYIWMLPLCPDRIVECTILDAPYNRSVANDDAKPNIHKVYIIKRVFDAVSTHADNVNTWKTLSSTYNYISISVPTFCCMVLSRFASDFLCLVNFWL